MFRQCLASAPLAEAVPAVPGWWQSTTVLPWHGELAVAAGIVLGFFFGRARSVSFTRCLKRSSGCAPLPELWQCPVQAGGSWDPRGGTRGRAHVVEAPQPRMWAKLHLLNKTVLFQMVPVLLVWRLPRKTCGQPQRGLRPGAVQTLLWGGKAKVELLQAWPLPCCPYSSCPRGQDPSCGAAAPPSWGQAEPRAEC